MKRSSFYTVLLFVFSFYIFPTDSFSRQAAFSGKKPNIIFIMADDLGYGEPGCYGQKIIKHEHITSRLFPFPELEKYVKDHLEG